MRRRRNDEPLPWEELRTLLGGWEDPDGHLRAAKRHLLLFLKELIERELSSMEEPPAGRPGRRRPQSVPVRRRQAGYHPR